jgi:glycosyltransferase involved in cell wall biosynthesis
MKTAIIIPTYNRPALVARMLDSLNRCHFPDDVEVIVVENGKRNGTEEVCQNQPLGGRVRYLFVEQAGRSLALNTGMRQSDADFLIFFDDDLRFAPEIVSLYVAAAKKYGPRHFFGGRLIADAEVPCSSHLLPHLPSSCKDWALPHDGATIALTDEMMFFGANWAGFRIDIEQVGNFSESIGVTSSKLSPVGEETIMQRSMLEAGMNGIYIHDAAIYHLVPKECYTVQ